MKLDSHFLRLLCIVYAHYYSAKMEQKKCFICWRGSVDYPEQLEPLQITRIHYRQHIHQTEDFHSNFSPVTDAITANYSLKCQLSVVFLLRKILGIHSDTIATVLEKCHGDNPSDWGIKLCSSCHRLFRETEFVYRRLLKFQADFHALSKEIQELIVTSAEEGSTTITLSEHGSCSTSTKTNFQMPRRPGRRSRKKRKREKANEAEEYNVSPENKSVVDNLRNIFVDAWKSSTGLDRSSPNVLFSTSGTHSILDGVYTTKPIQVKVTGNHLRPHAPSNSSITVQSPSAGGKNPKMPTQSSSISNEKASNDTPESTDNLLAGEPSLPIVKHELIDEFYDTNNGNAENCYFDTDDTCGVPSPPVVDSDINDQGDYQFSNRILRTGKLAEKKTVVGVDRDEDKEDNSDDNDSDYQPKRDAAKPKNDKRFTRKKPNIRENMRKKQNRSLKAASFGKVAAGVNVEPVEMKDKHDGNNFSCPQEGCELNFGKKIECHVHVLRDHYEDPMPYHCHVCDSKRFEREMSLRKHMVRFHRSAKCPYDDGYDPELHSAEKLKSIVEADEIWKSFLSMSKEDGPRDSEHSSDDEGVPGVPNFPDEILQKFRDDKDGNLFCCRHTPCKRQFTNEMLRDGHEKRIHQGIEKPFECEKCNKPFLRRTRLLAHMAVAHYSNQYSCHHCGSRFADKVLLAGHIGRTHLGNNTPFKCTSCPMQFARRTKMDLHMFKKHGTPLPSKAPKRRIPARAIPVPKIIPSKAKKILDGEEKEVSQVSKKCWVCHSEDGKPMLFDTTEDLKEHVEQKHTIVGEDKPFKCPVKNCFKEYRTNGKLDCHMVNIHNGLINDVSPKEFKCSHCEQSFHRPYLLDAHMAKYHGASMYMCNFCAKQFRTQRYLDDHQRQTHYKELSIDPFKCIRCGKVMNTKKSLDHHVKMVHTKETPYNCAVSGCGFGTMYPSALKVHMNIKHSNKKNAICPVCSRTFAAQFYLNRHMRLHTGEKPYKCNICDKLFSDLSTFNRHMEAHDGRRHKCPLDHCGKEYNTRHAYRVHLKQHQQRGDQVEVPNYRNRPLLEYVDVDRTYIEKDSIASVENISEISKVDSDITVKEGSAVTVLERKENSNNALQIQQMGSAPSTSSTENNIGQLLQEEQPDMNFRF